MFKIKKNQQEAFEREHVDDFVACLELRLKKDFRDELTRHGIEDADIASLIRLGITEAEGVGVVIENDVRFFVECMVFLSPDFAHSSIFPWAFDILHNERLTGTEKMTQIHDHIMFSRFF